MLCIPENYLLLPNKPSYWDVTHFDIAIVGAGITGSMVAFFLEQYAPNLKIALLDSHPTPNGATTRNAGFACFGSISEFLDDKTTHGEAYAVNLMHRRLAGLSILGDVFKNDDVGWKNYGGVELFTSETVFNQCVEMIPHVNRLLNDKSDTAFKVKVYDSIENGLSGDVKSIANQREGCIDSGLMISALHRKLKSTRFFFGCKVDGLFANGNRVRIETTHYNINAQHVIVATNGFSKSLIPELNVLPNRGQILVTSPLPSFKIHENMHYDRGYYYARQLEDKRILIGGGRHLDKTNEQTDVMETTPKIQRALEGVLRDTLLPEDVDFTVDYRWAGIMAFGENNEKEPLVGRNGNIHYIVRMGGMGVALAPITAKEWVLQFLS